MPHSVDPGRAWRCSQLVASGFATGPRLRGFAAQARGARTSPRSRLCTLVLFQAPNRARRSRLSAPAWSRRMARRAHLRDAVLRGRWLALEELRGGTIAIEGPAPGKPAAAEDIDAAADRLLASGLSSRDAARQLAADIGLARSDAYARVLARAKRGG
jgi:hypothetical protein